MQVPPNPWQRPRGTLKCQACRNRKVKASGLNLISFRFTLLESNPQQCEPRERNWSNQERCFPCQNLGLPCGPKVTCPPKPTIAAPNVNQASAPSNAVVVSTRAPRDTSKAPTLAIQREGAASRPSTARLRGSSPSSSNITSSANATSATSNNSDSVKNQVSFVASKWVETAPVSARYAPR